MNNDFVNIQNFKFSTVKYNLYYIYCGFFFFFFLEDGVWANSFFSGSA